MFQFFYIALVSVIALLVRCQEQTADLCQLDPETKQNLCLFIDVYSFYNRNLFALVKNKQAVIDEAVYQLQNPQNVTSVDDLYQELTKYTNLLRGLDASARAYMSTQEYQVESAVASVTNMANTYLMRAHTHIEYIQQTMGYISNNTSPTSTLVNVSARKLEQIYAETYYVTNKMSALLSLWLQNCNSACYIISSYRGINITV